MDTLYLCTDDTAGFVCHLFTFRTMRSSSARFLTVPRYLSLGSRAFRISAPTTWNSLPQIVRECSSLASFRNHLKTHYFISAFSFISAL